MAFDETQAEPVTEPDTENATKFYGYDISAHYDTTHRLDGSERLSDFYSRLASYNTGIRNGRWGDNQALRRQDNLALFDSIASKLELTKHQHRISRHAFDELDLSELSSPGGIDAALCAIMVAAHAARVDGRLYHPNGTEKSNDELFSALIADFGYPERVVHRCYAKIGDRVAF